MRDAGIGHSVREAGFTRIMSNSALASFHVPRFGMIFGTKVVLHPASAWEFGKCKKTHVYMENGVSQKMRCDQLIYIILKKLIGLIGFKIRYVD